VGEGERREGKEIKRWGVLENGVREDEV